MALPRPPGYRLMETVNRHLPIRTWKVSFTLIGAS